MSKLLFRAGLLAGFCLIAWGAQAQQANSPVVMQGEGVEITLQDLQAALAAMSPERAERARTKRVYLQSIAENLLIWRSLAERAEAEGLTDDPLIQKSLQLQREQTLGELMLSRAEGQVQAADVEELAELEYQANRSQMASLPVIQASHILIRIGEEGEAAARSKAESILQQLRQGQDFSRLARENSQDASAARGGRLGRLKMDRLVPEFKEALLQLTEPGQISEVVKSDFGFHIIRLEERSDAKIPDYAEVKDKLIAEKVLQMRNVRRQALVDPIRDPEKVTLHEEALESLLQPADAAE